MAKATTPVDDHGNEVLRKAAQLSSDSTKYDLRTKVSGFETNPTIDLAQFEHLINLNEKILKQLKIMNLHLSKISNEEFKNKDV